MEDEQPKIVEPVLTRGDVLLVGLLSVALFAGLLALLPPAAAAFTACLFLGMALITLADLRHFIIPDMLSLPAIPLGLAAHALILKEGDWLMGISDGLMGAVLGGGAFFLLRSLYFRLRGVEGLGLGDVKLAAAAGAWLGPSALAPACLVAALAALAGVLLHAGFSGRPQLHARLHIPFGSFIAPTIFLFWLLALAGVTPFG
jgi:leader peptidase (prepilin peptidase)/N-methyltransferase